MQGQNGACSFKIHYQQKTVFACYLYVSRHNKNVLPLLPPVNHTKYQGSIRIATKCIL